jgi:hypothetical protein
MGEDSATEHDRTTVRKVGAAVHQTKSEREMQLRRAAVILRRSSGSFAIEDRGVRGDGRKPLPEFRSAEKSLSCA